MEQKIGTDVTDVELETPEVKRDDYADSPSKVTELYKVNIEAIREYLSHEVEVYDLRKSEGISETLNSYGVNLNKSHVTHIGVGFNGLNDSVLTIHNEKSGISTLVLGKDTEAGSDPKMLQFALLIEVLTQVTRSLYQQPIWYRYWVVRYILERMDGNFAKIDLLEVDHFSPYEEDGEEIVPEITAIVPAQVAVSIGEKERGCYNVIKRINFIQVGEDTPTNIRSNELLPFVVCGSRYYGFNQVICLPHAVEIDPEAQVHEVSDERHIINTFFS